MSYEQFTLELLEERFGLTVAQADNLFAEVPPCAPSDLLTSGTDWRFLKLEGMQAILDLREYPITELESILGILVYMASAQQRGILAGH